MNLLAHSVLFLPSQDLAFFQSVLDDGFNFSLGFLDIGETGLNTLIFTVIEMHMLKQLVLRLQNRGLLLAIVLVIFNFIFQEFISFLDEPRHFLTGSPLLLCSQTLQHVLSIFIDMLFLPFIFPYEVVAAIFYQLLFLLPFQVFLSEISF